MKKDELNGKIIISIDGGSSTGKSTVSKLIAQKYDLSYIETGAIYRTVAYIVNKRAICLENAKNLENICQNLNLEFSFINGENKVFLDNVDISKEIRTPQITMFSSSVSSIPLVRAKLFDMQRNLAINTKKQGSIIDGRDIGTVVFPDASIKFFLTANNETKAKRRYLEIKDTNKNITYEDILQNIISRDTQDTTRNVAPLKKAKNAIHIDTDKLSIDEVVNLVSLNLEKLF